MPNFRKVLNENSEKYILLSRKKNEDQINYENKVKNFLNRVEYLKTGVEKRLSPNSTVLSFNEEFNAAFESFMNARLSRTSRVLNEMYKKLKELYKELEKAFEKEREKLIDLDKDIKYQDERLVKLRKKLTIGENYKKIVEALTYKSKTSNGDYIKRSSIDNPKVTKLFEDVRSAIGTKFAHSNNR